MHIEKNTADLNREIPVSAQRDNTETSRNPLFTQSEKAVPDRGLLMLTILQSGTNAGQEKKIEFDLNGKKGVALYSKNDASKSVIEFDGKTFRIGRVADGSEHKEPGKANDELRMQSVAKHVHSMQDNETRILQTATGGQLVNVSPVNAEPGRSYSGTVILQSKGYLYQQQDTGSIVRHHTQHLAGVNTKGMAKGSQMQIRYTDSGIGLVKPGKPAQEKSGASSTDKKLGRAEKSYVGAAIDR